MAGFGLIGDLLGGIFGGFGGSNTVKPINTVGTTNPVTDIVMDNTGNIMDLDAVQPGSVVGAMGADGKWYGQDFGNTKIDASNFGNGFNSQAGPQSVLQQKDGGFGLNMDNVTKLAGLGSAIWSDYANRKYQKDVANRKIDDKNNRRAQARAIKEQLKTGKTTDELSGQDIRHI